MQMRTPFRATHWESNQEKYFSTFSTKTKAFPLKMISVKLVLLSYVLSSCGSVFILLLFGYTLLFYSQIFKLNPSVMFGAVLSTFIYIILFKPLHPSVRQSIEKGFQLWQPWLLSWDSIDQISLLTQINLRCSASLVLGFKPEAQIVVAGKSLVSSCLRHIYVYNSKLARTTLRDLVLKK